MDFNYKRRLVYPYWVDDMETWKWPVAGMFCGPALLMGSDPGKANLLWLALGLEVPPKAPPPGLASNLLYSWVVYESQKYPVLALASMYTLPEFAARIGGLRSESFQVAQMLLTLKMLAEKRCRCANN
jgi:hypothetical protein